MDRSETAWIVAGAIGFGLMALVMMDPASEWRPDSKVTQNLFAACGAVLLTSSFCRLLLLPILDAWEATAYRRAERRVIEARAREINFRSQVHRLDGGEGISWASPLPVAGAEKAVSTLTPTPEEEPGEGGEILPITDKHGRMIRGVNIPHRIKRRYSMRQLEQIADMDKRSPEMPTSRIAAKVLGHKGGWQNRVVDYIRGRGECPW